MHAYLCSAGSEPALLQELARAGQPATTRAPGVVEADHDAGDPVFARQVMPDAQLVTGTSVRTIAEAVYAAVEAVVDRWPGPFLLHDLAHAEPPPGLASRAAGVARELRALLAARRKRASRRERSLDEAFQKFDDEWLVVQLLALSRERMLVSAAPPRVLPHGGFDVAPWPGGDAPVAIDRAPPSRAYQKLEEALSWLRREPRPGEVCVDLGASPGGWTATLLKRGARVVAVDRAPLDPAVARNARVTSVIGNAFTYAPPSPVDWMVSDVVCEPPRSLALAETWLASGWCQKLIVTVKFKGQAGYGVLDGVSDRLAAAGARFVRVKQLAHNKNEVTILAHR